MKWKNRFPVGPIFSQSLCDSYGVVLRHVCSACLTKLFTLLECFQILSHGNYIIQLILLGFYVTVQHNVVHNCDVDEKDKKPFQYILHMHFKISEVSTKPIQTTTLQKPLALQLHVTQDNL